MCPLPATRQTIIYINEINEKGLNLTIGINVHLHCIDTKNVNLIIKLKLIK